MLREFLQRAWIFLPAIGGSLVAVPATYFSLAILLDRPFVNVRTHALFAACGLAILALSHALRGNREITFARLLTTIPIMYAGLFASTAIWLLFRWQGWH